MSTNTMDSWTKPWAPENGSKYLDCIHPNQMDDGLSYTRLVRSEFGTPSFQSKRGEMASGVYDAIVEVLFDGSSGIDEGDGIVDIGVDDSDINEVFEPLVRKIFEAYKNNKNIDVHFSKTRIPNRIRPGTAQMFVFFDAPKQRQLEAIEVIYDFDSKTFQFYSKQSEEVVGEYLKQMGDPYNNSREELNGVPMGILYGKGFKLTVKELTLLVKRVKDFNAWLLGRMVS